MAGALHSLDFQPVKRPSSTTSQYFGALDRLRASDLGSPPRLILLNAGRDAAFLRPYAPLRRVSATSLLAMATIPAPDPAPTIRNVVGGGRCDAARLPDAQAHGSFGDLCAGGL